MVAYRFGSSEVQETLTRRDAIRAVQVQCIADYPSEVDRCKHEGKEAMADLAHSREGGSNSQYSESEQPDFPVDSNTIIKIPKRSVRRVICRIYIGSEGHTGKDWGLVEDVVEFSTTRRIRLAIYIAR